MARRPLYGRGQGGQGGSVETRPNPEVPSKAVRSRPFRKLVGGHDSELDALYNEDRMGPRSQVAQQTSDLEKYADDVNPAAGTGQDAEKVVAEQSATQQGSGPRARYLGQGEKGHGRSIGRVGMMRAKRKMRKAFGMQMPQQSGNVRGMSYGSKAGQQAPFASKKGGHGLNKYAPTKAKTSVAPGNR